MKIKKHTSKQQRNQVSDKFYHSSQWRKKRKTILERDNHLCQTCLSAGRVTQGNTVDHVKPIKQGGEPLADYNLKTICESCHARKSAREKR